MTELKGIKLEDLNVTKETYINLICLLNPDLELPDDERIIFEEEVEKCESGQVIAFYHLLVYGDNLYNFCLSFFSSSLSGNSFYLSGYNVDTCDISKQYLLDCLYKSGILTSPPVEDENTSEPEQPAEDAEEPADNAEYEEECFSVECSDRTNGKIKLTLGTGKNAVTKYYSSYDEMYEDNPEYRELFFEVLSVNARLSPLERVVFEEIENCYERYNEYSELVKVAEYGTEYNGESAEEISRYGHLANEQIFNSDYLKELISKAGLDGTYQAWLKERREREAVREAK